jgi:hypothetical protein
MEPFLTTAAFSGATATPGRTVLDQSRSKIPTRMFSKIVIELFQSLFWQTRFFEVEDIFEKIIFVNDFWVVSPTFLELYLISKVVLFP